MRGVWKYSGSYFLNFTLECTWWHKLWSSLNFSGTIMSFWMLRVASAENAFHQIALYFHQYLYFHLLLHPSFQLEDSSLVMITFQWHYINFFSWFCAVPLLSSLIFSLFFFLPWPFCLRLHVYLLCPIASHEAPAFLGGRHPFVKNDCSIYHAVPGLNLWCTFPSTTWRARLFTRCISCNFATAMFFTEAVHSHSKSFWFVILLLLIVAIPTLHVFLRKLLDFQCLCT